MQKQSWFERMIGAIQAMATSAANAFRQTSPDLSSEPPKQVAYLSGRNAYRANRNQARREYRKAQWKLAQRALRGDWPV